MRRRRGAVLVARMRHLVGGFPEQAENMSRHLPRVVLSDRRRIRNSCFTIVYAAQPNLLKGLIIEKRMIIHVKTYYNAWITARQSGNNGIPRESYGSSKFSDSKTSD